MESPAKAEAIEKLLGEGYKVMSSYGHIRDLKTRGFSIDLEHSYASGYMIPPDKKKLVIGLKNEAKKVKQVWLASDEDREGEAISWHLHKVLGLKPEGTKRVIFHEITENAILHTIETPRDIDIDLVSAQQARCILDRIVGLELSPILWRKVKPALSAGRVQSAAVCLIVEREREINGFVSEATYRVIASFILSDGTTILKAELNRRLKDKEEVGAFLESCKSASFTIDNISKKPVHKIPVPPFTTFTLQQEAARKLDYSASQTMMTAQRLYESGLIAYMRTNPVNLSDLTLGTAKEAILDTYGEKYYKLRQYHTEGKGTQEAREAIHPAYISNDEASGIAQEKGLYELIRRRTIICQMADAELERTTISIGIGGKKEKSMTAGEAVIFDGFLQACREGFDDKNEKEQKNDFLPPVTLSEVLSMKDIVATERFIRRPPRHTEADLVRRLKELGIGRPSTYAPTIQTIRNREYVVKGDKEETERTYNIITSDRHTIKEVQKTEIVGADRNKLMPADIGTVVDGSLTEYLPDVMDYNFMVSVKGGFGAVTEDEVVWTDAIDKFYRLFHPIAEETASARTEYKVGGHELGIDPKSGRPIFIKIGRYGPVVQIGQTHPEDKEVPRPQFAALMRGQSIETITSEGALKLFDLPRTIGEYEDKVMVAAVGHFGPSIRHDGEFVSIPKGLNPLSITAKEAIELIEAKKQEDEQRFAKKLDENPEMEILNSHFGPCISYKKKNYRIPKTIEKPENLTLEECQEVIVKAGEKPAATKKRMTQEKA